MKRFIQGEHRGQSTLLPESLDDYVSDTNPVRVVDRQIPSASAPDTASLEDKLAKLKAHMKELQGIETQLNDSPDKQVSLTDPDARSMMTRGSGIVGYNVQTAVDTQHHLIVAHEVTNSGSDRDQLSSMAKQAREAIGAETLSVVADRGYFKGEEILACHDANITAYVPKPMTSSAKADGRFNKDGGCPNFCVTGS